MPYKLLKSQSIILNQMKWLVRYLPLPLPKGLGLGLGLGSDSINTSGLLVFLSNKLKKFKNNRPSFGVRILLIGIFSIFLYYYLSYATNLPLEKYLNLYLLILTPVLIFMCLLTLYLLHFLKNNPFLYGKYLLFFLSLF